MLETRLIFVDGIAGSGKSTIGQRLYRVLHLNGYPAEFYHEFYRPHPVLQVEAVEVGEWVEQTLSKWETFCQQLDRSSAVAIVDGVLFQCGIGALLECDAGEDAIHDYISRVENLVKPLRPVFIHLYQQDVSAALRQVYDLRPVAWKRRVETMLDDTAYGRATQLTGFDLYLDYNRTLRRCSDAVFERLAQPKLLLESSDCQWNRHFDLLCRFLQVPQTDDPFDPAEYGGDYRDSETGRNCRIGTEAGQVRVTGLFEIVKNLLPKHDDVLFVQTWPDELTFERNDEGRIVSFRSTGTWNRIGDATWWRDEKV